MWDSGHSGRAGDSRASSGRRFLVNTPTVRTPQQALRAPMKTKWCVKPMFCFVSVLYTHFNKHTYYVKQRVSWFYIGNQIQFTLYRCIVQNQLSKSFTQRSFSLTQSLKQIHMDSNSLTHIHIYKHWFKLPHMLSHVSKPSLRNWKMYSTTTTTFCTGTAQHLDIYVLFQVYLSIKYI